MNMHEYLSGTVFLSDALMLGNSHKWLVGAIRIMQLIKRMDKFGSGIIPACIVRNEIVWMTRNTKRGFAKQFSIPKTRMPHSATSTMTTQSSASALANNDVDFSSTQGYDEEQIRLMEEVCIVIDENDQPLRAGTKKECIVCLAPMLTRQAT